MDSTDAFTKEFIFGTCLAQAIKIDRERQFNVLSDRENKDRMFKKFAKANSLPKFSRRSKEQTRRERKRERSLEEHS